MVIIDVIQGAVDWEVTADTLTACVARHTSPYASGEILTDAAKMLWHLYGRAEAIVLPLQGAAFLEKMQVIHHHHAPSC